MADNPYAVLSGPPASAAPAASGPSSNPYAVLSGGTPAPTTTGKPPNIGAAIGGAVGGAAKGVWDYTMGKAIPSAVEGANAVLGAPQRAVAGAIGADDLAHAASSAVYGAFHPNDPSVEDKAEQRLGVSRLKGHGGLADAGVDFGFQTATDPTMLFGIGEVRRALMLPALGEKALGALYKVAPKMEEALRPDVVVRRALSPRDAATYEGVVERERAIAQRDQAALKATAEKYVAGKLTPTEKATFLQRMRQLGVDMNPRGQGHNPPTPRKMPAHVNDAAEALKALTTAHNQEREVKIAKALAAEGLKYLQQPEREATNAFSLAAKTLSNLGKNALFVNSLPHMGNIAVLTWLHGGEEAMARGLRHFADPKFMDSPLVKELEHFGGTSHFSKSEEMGFDKVPIAGPATKWIRDKSQGMLDRWETAMRAGRYEQLLAKAPRSAPKPEAPRALMHNYDPVPPKPIRHGNTPDSVIDDRERYWAAANVRRELGDYTNTSGLTRMLSDVFGAPFPQWRFVSVPQSLGKAALNSPHRLTTGIRAEHLFNQDVVGNKPYEIESGKPIAEGAKMLTQPGKYALSPSSLGILGTGASMLLYPKEAGKIAQQTVENYIPGASLVGPLISPFQNPAPMTLREALGLVGAYAKKRPVPQQ